MSRFTSWFDDLLHDVRYGIRGLVRDRGFAVTAMVVLGIGVGLNLSFFHLVTATLENQIPVPGGDTLVRIVRQSPDRERWGFTAEALSFYRASTTVFDYLVGERIGSTPVQVERDEDDARARFVSANYFDALGVAATVGRLPSTRDGAPGAPLVAALGEGYWQRRFGGAWSDVPQTITVNGKPVIVVGVVPAAFTGVSMSRGDLWFPDSAREPLLADAARGRLADPVDVAIVAQPRRGVSAAQMSAQVGGLTDRLRQQQPTLMGDRDGVLVRAVAGDEPPGNGRMISAVLALLVLLTSCANVGNMLLARGVARRREIETRIAVGASRSRLVRQLMTESVVLSCGAAAVGLAISLVGARVLMARFVSQINVQVTTDLPVVGAALGLTLVCALAFGLAPARHISSLRTRAPRSRQGLVAVQVAASCVLLVLAGLLTRGAQRQLDLAGRADHTSILVVEPELDTDRLSAADARDIVATMAERVRTLPGVAAVAIADDPVYAPAVLSTDVMPVILQSRVTPEYFDVMQVVRLRGRLFEQGERAVAVISRSAARAAFGEDDPLGRLWTTGPSNTPATVIGVVEDSPLATLRDPRAVEAYVPLDDAIAGRVPVLVRTDGDARTRLREARAAATLTGTSPTAWLVQRPVDQLLQHSVIAAEMIGALGAIAAALAAFGIFGLLAFTVRERTRELAIRRALGARVRSIAALLLRQYLGPLGAGIVAGGLVASLVARVMIGVAAGLGLDSSLDPAGYALGFAAFGVALVAAVLPAVRGAARIDATAALRAE
jgi:predicted permease